MIANVVIRMTRGNKGESRIAFGKHKSIQHRLHLRFRALKKENIFGVICE